MKYDAASKTLQFASEEEVSAFHRQMTDVMRDAMCAVNDGVIDPKEAVKRADEFFGSYGVLMAAINEFRGSLQRHGT